jgi:hypothetical protein
VFPECDLVHEFKIFEFLSLQIQINHNLSLLEQLLAEPKDPESFFQPMRVLVLGVPVLEETMFDESRLQVL